jgi:sialate O-acetylesterase
MRLIFAIFAGAALVQGNLALAEVKPHALVSEGMVLQGGVPASIWGTASQNEKVSISFQGQEVCTTASGGRWTIRLQNLKTGGPFSMTISGSNLIRLKSVFVGEVWVCSGQSNMWWPVAMSGVSPQVISNSRNPRIRIFTVPFRPTETPQKELREVPKGPGQWAVGDRHYTPTWKECGPETIPDISAVGFFFARDLQRALGVPLGLIHCPVGGTTAEAWMSRRALEETPELRRIQGHFLSDYHKRVDKYLSDLDTHKEAVIRAMREGKDLPQPPAHPDYAFPNQYLPFSKNFLRPSIYYNGMLAPLLPYAIRGAIWYQGESNTGRPAEYQTVFTAMIKNWRHDWHQGTFPFLFVQLAPFMKIEPEPQESAWAELREAQRLTSLTVPNTALAVIADAGDEKDIHPKRKDIVGARLALAARAIAYDEKIEYSGPVYDHMNVEGDRVVLTFRHVGGGLVARGGSVQGFTIAGKDRRFVNAEARIQDAKVVVWSPRVTEPVTVRFGWANYPVVNLWNNEGLPASPFSTEIPQR